MSTKQYRFHPNQSGHDYRSLGIDMFVIHPRRSGHDYRSLGIDMFVIHPGRSGHDYHSVVIGCFLTHLASQVTTTEALESICFYPAWPIISLTNVEALESICLLSTLLAIEFPLISARAVGCLEQDYF